MRIWTIEVGDVPHGIHVYGLATDSNRGAMIEEATAHQRRCYGPTDEVWTRWPNGHAEDGAVRWRGSAGGWLYATPVDIGPDPEDTEGALAQRVSKLEAALANLVRLIVKQPDERIAAFAEALMNAGSMPLEIVLDYPPPHQPPPPAPAEEQHPQP